MPEAKNPLFSPFSVVKASLAFTFTNIPALAKWSFAPLVYGLAFQFLLPLAPKGEGEVPSLFVLLLLGAILLWIRVPLEVRVIRKALLGETPGHFYGLELLEKRTLRYMWAYVRVICLVVALLGPSMILALAAGESLAGKDGGGLQAGLPMTAWTVFAFVMLMVVYAFLAPKIVLVFPDAALDGQGLLFNTGSMGNLGRRARWRIVAVMAMVWAPVHSLHAFSYLAGESEFWKPVVDEWWFTLIGYLLAFTTLVVSCAAGAIISGNLREQAALRSESE